MSLSGLKVGHSVDAIAEGPCVSIGNCRVCPSAKGIDHSVGCQMASPARGYVAKLGLVCSPSVMTGEPVSSKWRDSVAEG